MSKSEGSKGRGPGSGTVVPAGWGVVSGQVGQSRPPVGAVITFRGEQYRCVRVYPFGTVDVLAVKGGGYYRLTGLGWL